jgi:hypothetical protein
LKRFFQQQSKSLFINSVNLVKKFIESNFLPNSIDYLTQLFTLLTLSEYSSSCLQSIFKFLFNKLINSKNEINDLTNKELEYYVKILTSFLTTKDINIIYK